MTPKMLGFTESTLEGKNGSEAYSLWYRTENMSPSTIANNAYKLLQRTDISTMLSERRAAVAAVATGAQAWDLDKLVKESEANMVLGRELGQIAASNGAISTIGKATGLLVERTEANVNVFHWRFTIGKGYDDDENLQNPTGLDEPIPLQEGQEP